jgi:hypothetical protein
MKCHCGWFGNGESQFRKGNFPSGGTGWGRTLIYGTEDDFKAVQNAHRDNYDKL